MLIGILLASIRNPVDKYGYGYGYGYADRIAGVDRWSYVDVLMRYEIL